MDEGKSEQSMRMGLPPVVLGAIIGKIHIERCSRAEETQPPMSEHVTHNIKDACRRSEAAIDGYKQAAKADVNSVEAKYLKQALSTIRCTVELFHTAFPSVAAETSAYFDDMDIEGSDAASDGDSDSEDDAICSGIGALGGLKRARPDCCSNDSCVYCQKMSDPSPYKDTGILRWIGGWR